MTLLERAEKLQGVLCGAPMGHPAIDVVLILEALAVAVSEEREACAAIAEDPKFFRMMHDDHLENNDIAAAIRARSTAEPPATLPGP